jgi:hypothetical protein
MILESRSLRWTGHVTQHGKYELNSVRANYWKTVTVKTGKVTEELY